MNTRQSPQSERKGAVMALVLLAIMILAIAGIGLLELGLRSRTMAARTATEIEARCAADAGLVKAVFEMNEKLKVTPWDDSILPEATDEVLPNCGATFSYTATGDLYNGYNIEAIGKSGWALKKANCTLELRGLFEAAIFANTTISLKEGTIVDWYNYDENEKKLQVGTNSIEWGSIDLKNNVFINGDVIVGSGGDPDVVIDASWVTITGDTYAMTEIYQLPSIEVPEYLELLPSNKTINDTNTITTSGKYDGINLGPGKIITIDGPVALNITGDIIFKNSSQLQIVDAETNPNASLTLYVGGNIDCRYGSALNNLTKDPKKLKVYGLDSCLDMDFKNSTDFYGAIYAPKADVTFYNSSDAYGAVIADSFEQLNTATFHYDASLRDVNIDEEAVRFIIKQWSEE
ncbi:MAG: hypothetical protein JSV82_06935 [Planctomycetota bacterium]|nr:MAG: hypothetical protein JSV82_06935 [Planctomycetota bacterium]